MRPACSLRAVTRAGDAEARLVLVGDVCKLASAGAGRAFAQLQEHKMETVVLDQIVRQTNDHTREAVEAMLTGEAARAFDAITRGGRAHRPAPRGRHPSRLHRPRFRRAVPRGSRRNARARSDPRGRQRLTDAIRLALLNDGTLGQDALVATVLEPCVLSKAETGSATSYVPGSGCRRQAPR